MPHSRWTQVKETDGDDDEEEEMHYSTSSYRSKCNDFLKELFDCYTDLKFKPLTAKSRTKYRAMLATLTAS